MQPLILFDIDGTLIRAGTEVHRASFAHAYRAIYGLELSLDGVAAAGRTDTWLLHEALRRGGVDEGTALRSMSAAFDAMCEYVDRELGDLRGKVLPGVAECLRELHANDALLGLLTGNLERIAHAKMRAAGLDGYFDMGAFGEESAWRPDLVPVALRKAAERSGAMIDPRAAVVVGDTPFDIEAGKVHGVKTCGVATGVIGSEELLAAEPDLVLESLAGDAWRRLMALAGVSAR